MTKSNKIRVLFSERQPIFRIGISYLLSRDEEITIVGEAGTVEQTLRLVEEREPSILLLDSVLTESTNPDLLQELQRRFKSVKVILLTPSDRDVSGEVLRRRTVGIIPKQATMAVLIDCIHKAESGESWQEGVSATAAGNAANSKSPSIKAGEEATPLSFRERQVVSLVSQGYRNKEIAERMFISEQTVKNHLHNIFDKLGVSDRLELALYAIHKNLQTLD